jgi:hypothetical protein
MTDVTVFVDDAVQGRLPMVCVRTGEPAEGLHRIHQTIGGGSPWAFLLIFLGPVGWIVLFGLSVFFRGRDLLVRLPYTEAALDDERGKFRAALIAGAAFVVIGVGAGITAAVLAHRSNVRETLLVLLVGATVVTFCAAVSFAVRYLTGRPKIELDASGRWVTVRGVHPRFAAALEDRDAQRRVAVDQA